MKLSERTTELLKSYSNINTVIRLVPDRKKLIAVSPNETIIAMAEIAEQFPVDCVLNNYSTIFKLFDDPEFNFEQTFVNISQGDWKQRFLYSHPVIAPKMPRDDLNVDLDFELVFDFTADDRKEITTVAKLIGAKTLRILPGKLVIMNGDTPDDETNIVTLKRESVQSSVSDNFDIKIEIDLFKFIPGDYTVSIIINAQNKIALFTNKNKEDGLTQYIVSVNSKSKLILKG